ncbi:MAG: type II toxin-antitoxin system tRNA(fMet)-specific endonuclease VapC [Nevskiales bacterium]
MLDTNICSYILRRKPQEVHNRFESLPAGAVVVSSIVAAELCYGAACHPQGREIQPEIDELLSGLEVTPWDEAAARVYGVLRTQLEVRGQLIGGLDLQIAAHALSLGATLVTNNQREFKRVPRLKLENWISE